MKHLLLFLFSGSIFFSCGSSELMTPSSYAFTKTEISKTTAYRYTNNNYEEVTLVVAGDPNTSGMTNGGINLLELLDSNKLKFDDGIGEVDESYTISGERLEFIANGSAYSMEIINDGEQLLVQRVGGGSFDELNPYPTASATCEDEGCDEVNPAGYIYASQEGEIGYVLIYNEIYTRI